MKNLLLFPCHIPHGEAFAETAEKLGFTVYRASSVEAEVGDGVHYLPYVSDETFQTRFDQLLAEQQIGWVYAAHDVVLDYLSTLLQTNAASAPFTLCNDSQHQVNNREYAQAEQWALTLTEGGDKAGVTRLNPWLPHKKYCHLYRAFHHIPGQSDSEKLSALVDIFTHAVQGDIVEIGCFWGRSSYALGYLAQHHGTGSLISVDPWNLPASLDQGQAASLVNKAVKLIGWEEVFQGFLTNVACLDNVNYIRDISSAAVEKYHQAAEQGALCSAELGRVAITGHISILHIDGNHKYEAVKEDIALWMPKVKSQGWILLDDYDWAFGDGPRRAGDELKDHPAIARWFVASDTLFLQVR